MEILVLVTTAPMVLVPVAVPVVSVQMVQAV
jgi:hypothetical protein